MFTNRNKIAYNLFCRLAQNKAVPILYPMGVPWQKKHPDKNVKKENSVKEPQKENSVSKAPKQEKTTKKTTATKTKTVAKVKPASVKEDKVKKTITKTSKPALADKEAIPVSAKNHSPMESHHKTNHKSLAQKEAPVPANTEKKETQIRISQSTMGF